MDKYIPDIKAKKDYANTIADQEEVRRAFLDVFSLIRQPNSENLLNSCYFRFFFFLEIFSFYTNQILPINLKDKLITTVKKIY